MKKHFEVKMDSKEIFNGKIINVTLDTVKLENGKTSFREIVHHNGGAGIIAINSSLEVALVRQYRYAMNKEMLEIPAGKIEVGEEPMQTAIRELEEEAACRAEIFEPFGTVIPTCAYCTETIYIFFATGLTLTEQNLDPDEFVDIVWMPLEEAVKKVISGEITDSKTSFALLKTQYLLNNNQLNYK